MVGKETPCFDANGETIWLRLCRDVGQTEGNSNYFQLVEMKDKSSNTGSKNRENVGFVL